ncbi:MAG: energy-coupling factor transporter ATPase [Clostridiales bacterium]|nr:energy-coupling factor transporter ATPase [Clostridiales bacterium]
MKMVDAKNVSYEYTKIVEVQGENTERKLMALEDINVEIEKGEFVAVLGHNGSGKSTFAKHLNALVTPSEGTVWIDGMDTKNDELVWNIRQSTGMVFQNPDNQLVATVVEEDIAFGPENLGVESSEIRRRVDEALKMVGMDGFQKDTPSKLSGGQKQRIAIAGILAMKPQCIVLDEPTAMLDPHGRKEVMDTIHRLNKENGITIILITHYMNEAATADRIYVIDDGKLVMQGKPKEIFSQVEKLKSYGLDVPQVTETAYNVRKMGIDIPQDILTVDEMVGAICQLKSTI